MIDSSFGCDVLTRQTDFSEMNAVRDKHEVPDAFRVCLLVREVAR